MNSPSRIKQLQFGLTMIMLGVVSLLFILAPANARKEFRDRGAKVFIEIGQELSIKYKE